MGGGGCLCVCVCECACMSVCVHVYVCVFCAQVLSCKLSILKSLQQIMISQGKTKQKTKHAKTWLETEELSLTLSLSTGRNAFPDHYIIALRPATFHC